MISDLKRYYPNTSNQELVELFGVSERTIVRKARELGLSKSKEHVSKVNKGKSVLAHIVKKKKSLINKIA
jgi:Zn-dependent peptidase ImmA (M78 family)